MTEPLLIEINVLNDDRGFFYESYNSSLLNNLSIKHNFLQDNCSRSFKAGTIRGLHCQVLPHPQAKLVRCTRGKILDVVVDVRKSSPNFAKYKTFELSEYTPASLYVPEGFLHGFITLVDNTEVTYKCSELYNPSCDRSVAYNDPLFNIDWPKFDNEYILSEKDYSAKYFNDQDIIF